MRVISLGLFALLGCPVGGCALAPPPALEVPLGAAVLRLGQLQQQGMVGRLPAVQLQVGQDAQGRRSWAFEFLLFDDRDGDGKPNAAEFLARRQALGSRPCTVQFPRLQFRGRAARPHLQLCFRDGRLTHRTTLALPGAE